MKTFDFHKNFAYVGITGLVIIAFAALRFFLYGDSSTEGAIFGLGMALVILPTVSFQITIPAGIENIPVIGIVFLYICFIPIDALLVVCVKAITQTMHRGDGTFPWIAVGIIYTSTLLMGFGLKIFREREKSAI